MKTRICSFLTFFFLSLSVSAFAQQIDVKHIALDLNFDWKLRQASGLADIHFSPLAETGIIRLDAGMLSINSVTLANGKVLAFKYDGGDTDNGLEITLDKIYQPSQTIILKINYHTNYVNESDPMNIAGSFGKGLRFFEPTSTCPKKRKQIWSSGEPENNKYWYPCNEDIADLLTFSFTATVEKPLMVIANGNLIETKELKDGKQKFHYDAVNAHPNYLNSFVAGEYVCVQQISNGVPVKTFGYPDEQEAVKATVELLPDMLQFISEKTGYAYPYSQYAQVVVQDYPFPGLNGQHTLSTISDNYIDDYGVHRDFKYLWDGVAVEALASQWFGNLITPKSWKDIWLNNAFTQYFSGLYTSEKNGKEEYQLYYSPFEKSNVLNDWNSGNIHPVVSGTISDLAGYTSDSYSKFRGALVLRMLQKELGEENWWKAIRYYVKTNAGKQTETADFQKAIELISGKSYQWFFDQWIYKVGLPEFLISKNYNASEGVLTVLVKQVPQTDSANGYPQLKYFRGKVELEIDNRIETVNLEAKEENRFVFAMKEAPKLVVFDYEESWVCRIKQERTFEELLYQLENDLSVAGRTSAIDELILHAMQDSLRPTNKIIIEKIKKQITSETYWRYRLYALSALRIIMQTPYDDSTLALLQHIIRTDSSWIKVSALTMLGKTKDEKYLAVYTAALNDESDRVVNAAAIAIGNTGSKKAFAILTELENKPSWKNQNRISALNGLQVLADTNAIPYALKCLQDNSSPRWYLATPVWDYPFAAANTLVALGAAASGYPVIFNQFKKAIEENDVNDIFQNVQLIIILADKRGTECFEILKTKYAGNTEMMNAVLNYEEQFKAATEGQ